MKNYGKILQTIGGISLALLGIILVLSSARSDSIRRCSGLNIKLIDDRNQYLVTEKDIENWATQNGIEKFDRMPIKEIDLANVERRITNGGVVKTCEAYFDLNGKLTLEVEVFKPIARVLAGHSFPDRYMDDEGHFFPVSKNHKPTVLLLSGNYFNNRTGLKSEKNRDLLELINKLERDNFWNAQITQLEINSSKEITMVPLLGNHIIEFGKPENVENKLKKLIVFYKKILPEDKWSNFSKVSVKFDGQIVCN